MENLPLSALLPHTFATGPNRIKYVAGTKKPTSFQCTFNAKSAKFKETWEINNLFKFLKAYCFSICKKQSRAVARERKARIKRKIERWRNCKRQIAAKLPLALKLLGEVR